jgi:hypothetical protein
MAVLNRRLLTCFGLLACFSADAFTQTAMSAAQARASFLYNCVMFIEWPGTAASGDVTIGVAGDAPVSALMAEMQGRKVNGRTMRVRTIKAAEDPRDVQVLFIGDEIREVDSLLARTSNAAVLTVSERDDFTRRGGVVRLYTEDSRIRFEINMTQAEQAGLRVSAKMLGLAKIVR